MEKAGEVFRNIDRFRARVDPVHDSFVSAGIVLFDPPELQLHLLHVDGEVEG